MERTSPPSANLNSVIWALVVAVMMAVPSPMAGRTAYGWPLEEVRVTRRFDPPPQPWLPGHRGVDLAGHPGDTVASAAAGRISFAGTVAGRGVVSIVHPDGIKTTYEPVTPAVTTGTAVSRGTAVATLEPGHDGCPASACLHWGAMRGETYIDPLTLLGLGKIRLKPLTAMTAAPAARPPAAARLRKPRRPVRISATARRCR
jgi:murein DD-endopeptidase MepM/ murein hydrolase activator NlpD